MKRLFATLLTFSLLLILTACTTAPMETEQPAPQAEPTPTLEEAPPEAPPMEEEPFPGKILIFTEYYEEEANPALLAVKKYGADKVKVCNVHWGLFNPDEIPLNLGYKLVSQYLNGYDETEIKALIIDYTSVPNAERIPYMLRDKRDYFDGVFISLVNTPVYAATNDSFLPSKYSNSRGSDIALRHEYPTTLIMYVDDLSVGSAMVRQAQKMSAETFVYYSFPRHMSDPLLLEQQKLANEECSKQGITFVYAEAIDPTSEAGTDGAQQFILKDVPKMVKRYGKDTAFFCTNSFLQDPLIKAVVETGAIFPQPYNTSLFYNAPLTFGDSEYEFPEEYQGLSEKSLQNNISETARMLKEHDMLGRVSTWPIPVNILTTVAAVEYAVKLINGEALKEGIDLALLEQCMEEYAGVACVARPYVDENGVEYPNFLLVREDYLTFGEEHIKGD